MELSFQHKKNWLYGAGGLIVSLIGLLVYLEIFYVAILIPIFLLIVGLALFRMDWLYLLIVFSTPLSLNLEKIEFGLGVILPTEPLMAGAMLVFFGKVLYDQEFDKRILKHPITLLIVGHLIWMGITMLTSEMPVVSLKFFISRLWFVITGYFIAVRVFKYPRYINSFFWLFTIAFLVVIFYTIYQHGIRGFEEKPAHWVMQPFFKDHTSYGAILAFYLPVLTAYLFKSDFRWNLKFITFFVLLIFIAAIILSYTRAAWVSVAAALVVYFLIQFRVKFSLLLGVGVLALAMFFTFQEQIFIKLEKNRQDSSGDLAEHVQSISNVASDASNLERINRWNSALRMWSERPVFGFGPGTYMFQYAPYQHSSELTIISTNFGDLGNAHSEYLGPLAEQGVLGMLLMLALIAVVFTMAIRRYQKLQHQGLRTVLMAAILGLVTYFTHGFLNNFLDLDKASIPVWGAMAIIVAIDVYHHHATDVPTEGQKG